MKMSIFRFLSEIERKKDSKSCCGHSDKIFCETQHTQTVFLYPPLSYFHTLSIKTLSYNLIRFMYFIILVIIQKFL